MKEKVVLDTNIWIGFLIAKDFTRLDKLLFSHKVTLIFSKELLEEFIEVAQRPKFKKYFSSQDIEDILNTIDEYAYFVEAKSKTDICRDEKDNFLLSLSIDGQADFLITGDPEIKTFWN